LQAYTNGQ